MVISLPTDEPDLDKLTRFRTSPRNLREPM